MSKFRARVSSRASHWRGLSMLQRFVPCWRRYSKVVARLFWYESHMRFMCCRAHLTPNSDGRFVATAKRCRRREPGAPSARLQCTAARYQLYPLSLHRRPGMSKEALEDPQDLLRGGMKNYCGRDLNTIIEAKLSTYGTMICARRIFYIIQVFTEQSYVSSPLLTVPYRFSLYLLCPLADAIILNMLG